jgi:hypothetical protein
MTNKFKNTEAKYFSHYLSAIAVQKDKFSLNGSVSQRFLIVLGFNL